MKTQAIAQRVVAKQIAPRITVQPYGDCWEFQGSRVPAGYGKVSVTWAKNKATQEYVHRMVYIAAHGELADTEVVMHRCDNPQCCNPAHLQLGNAYENAKDRDQRGGGHVVRLYPSELEDIRRAYWNGGVTQGALAAAYGVSQPNICRIVKTPPLHLQRQPKLRSN